MSFKFCSDVTPESPAPHLILKQPLLLWSSCHQPMRMKFFAAWKAAPSRECLMIFHLILVGG